MSAARVLAVGRPGPGSRSAAAFVMSLLAMGAASATDRAWLLLPAAWLLAWAWRGTRRVAGAFAAGALVVLVAGVAETRLVRRVSAPDEPLIEQRLDTVRARFRLAVDELTAAAHDAAAGAQVAAALAGQAPARARVFTDLERLRAGRPIELALQTRELEPVAWAGRPADLNGYRDVLGLRTEVVVLEGALSTSLLAVAPVPGAEGRPIGLVTAERVLASRPNLRNRFVSDFDRLADGLPGVTLQYYDVRDDPRTAHPMESPPPGLPARDARLTAADGRLLAVALATAAPSDPAPTHRALARRAASLLLALALVAWGYIGRAVLGPHALIATAVLRAICVLAGTPFPAPPSELLSPDTYASPLLGPLLRSPLDLLLTLAALAHAVAALLSRLSRWPVPRPSLARLLGCGLIAPVLLAAPFAWIGDATANTSLDLETLTLVPRTASHLALQVSLLLVLALGGAALALLMSWAGPLPDSRVERVALVAGWLAVGAVSYAFWPRRQFGLPLVPALALFALAATLGLTRGRIQAWFARASPARRAGLVPAAAACGALLLYPSLAHFGEKEARHQIEHDEAPLILRQPQWRDYVLEQTCRRIDALRLVEGAYSTRHPLGVEQLAFAVWSATDLAAFGFSSAVEVQDAHGGLVSRFALNLPTLDVPAAALPESERWVVDRERLRVGSAAREVLHARRLIGAGAARGGVHVYLADDFWNLPFLPARDAFGTLYRPDPRPGAGGRDLVLLVYDREHAVQFATAERPPALTADLLERLRVAPHGFWTTLPIDGRPFHTFLFSDAQGTYALAYAQRRAERFVADLAEAALALTLVALVALLALMLVRTLLGRAELSLPGLVAGVRRRFRLRLFVAFVAVAIAPVAVMQGVVQGVVRERLRREAEDQALERASVAQKAVEDFVVYQRDQRDRAAPEVTDAALVWISSLIRNDLDVFADGRLLASSKRELYASGLLSARLSGPVFRELVLEGRPRALSSERLGDFAYRVVSVPVRLGAGRTGILRVPLALRERALQTVLADVDRVVRLASVLFLLLAAGLAQSMARRIAGPLRDLTAATRRVAQGDLSARVGTESRDELRELVEAFNQMAADLERQRHDLERSNRLAAWAEMARQVAHEVKNPLTPIQLSTEHLRRVWRDPQADFGAALETCTQTILRQVRTLRDIVTEFSAFARPPAGALAELDLAALARDVVQPYGAALPPGVTLSMEIPAGLRAPILGERRLLERALVNLIENALQAVEGNGVLRLRLQADPDAAEVLLEVEDTGPGIDPELRERVFEPFFSTKTGGSGLGLALVRKIAEEHGGGVALDSHPGRTCARLWLPRAPATPDPA